MQTEIPAIPGYTIVNKTPLGEGGFAKVYLAQHMGLQVNVALKIMDAKLADDVDFCKRFLQEARTCANLGNHPNIIHIYDVGRVGDSYYIAMQYISGPNLRDILDSGKPYNHPLEIIRPIVDALGYAHEHGVVHRDVKPANILFNESGCAMLADFGIAKSLNENTQLTAVGAAVGTAAYMSPEQAKGLAKIDGRSDLYSIGVLLYEMLSGSRPYQSTDQMGLMLQHVNDPIPQLPGSEIVYQSLISRLMAKEPDDRYQDHNAVLSDIDVLLTVKADPHHRDIENHFASRKKLLFGGAIVALVLAVSTIWLLSYDVENTSEDPSALPSIRNDDSPKIMRLLELAKMHEEYGELTEPPGSNALELYEAILRDDPDHPIALKRKDEINQLTGN